MSRVFTGNAANYLAPAANAAYSITTPAISIAAWVKRNSTGSGHTIYGQTNTAHYFIIGSDDKLDAEGAVSKKSTSTITNDSTWHHVAFTSDGSGNWAWYIDGVSDASGIGFLWGGQSTAVTVGQVAGILPLDGKLAYVAIWNTGLSSGNVTTLQTSTTPESVGSGCIASWHLNTSALTDSSATANDLVVTGTVSFDSDNPTLGSAVTLFKGVIGGGMGGKKMVIG